MKPILNLGHSFTLVIRELLPSSGVRIGSPRISDESLVSRMSLALRPG